MVGRPSPGTASGRAPASCTAALPAGASTCAWAETRATKCTAAAVLSIGATSASVSSAHLESLIDCAVFIRFVSPFSRVLLSFLPATVTLPAASRERCSISAIHEVACLPWLLTHIWLQGGITNRLCAFQARSQNHALKADIPKDTREQRKDQKGGNEIQRDGSKTQIGSKRGACHASG